MAFTLLFWSFPWLLLLALSWPRPCWLVGWAVSWIDQVVRLQRSLEWLAGCCDLFLLLVHALVGGLALLLPLDDADAEAEAEAETGED
jgi:hypothetical protein